jgi:tetratricopeptide (TPR) repeat protein
MKRAVTIAVAILLGSALVFAQTPAAPAAKTAPATQPQQPPAAGQTTPPAAGQTTPAGKHQPTAKTQPEFNEYQAILGQQDLTAAETAAEEFAKKYPDSELRAGLYQVLMNRYQQANNAEKTIEMGRKSLKLDPDNPVPLVLVATVIAERTRDTDIDKDEKIAEVNRNANHAIASVDQIPVPGNLPPDRVQAAKNTVISMAYAALGTAAIATENYAVAEQNLRKSVDVPGIEPDALTWLRLCIALDHQKKYAEALQAANKTAQIATQEPLLSMAKQEQSRLAKLAGSGAAPASTTATPPATTTPPPPPPAAGKPPQV